MLTGKGRGRQVFRRGAGADRIGGVHAELARRLGNGGRQIIRDGDSLDGASDLAAEGADRFPVARAHATQPFEPLVDR